MFVGSETYITILTATYKLNSILFFFQKARKFHKGEYKKEDEDKDPFSIDETEETALTRVDCYKKSGPSE